MSNEDSTANDSTDLLLALVQVAGPTLLSVILGLTIPFFFNYPLGLGWKIILSSFISFGS
jgi:hypothetical protein